MSHGTRPVAGSRDTIEVDGLAVRTIIGIFDEERQRKQEVLIRLEIAADIARAAASDAIEDALDYKRITKRVLAFVEDSSFFLVETLAERIAAVILDEFRTTWVRVRVEKPGALRFARTVAVTIARERNP